MDYEKAWKDLKMRIDISRWESLRCAESEDNKDNVRRYAKGGEIMAETILEYMSDVEKEMTTAGQDDGQSAQD